MTRLGIKPISVKVLLALIVGITLVPALVFSGYLLNRNNSAQQDIVTTLAASTVAANTDAIDRQLAGMISTIRALASSDALRNGNLAEFYSESSTALADTGTFAAVFDRDLNMVMNTRLPFGSAMPVGPATGPVGEALRSGKVVVSDAVTSRVAQQWVFSVTVPVEGVTSGLAITQNAETLGNTLRMENLRGGWNASVVDKEGVVLTSTFMTSDIGKPFFLEEAVKQFPQATTVSKDGNSYRLLSDKSEIAGWTVYLWADATTVSRPILRAYRSLLLGGLALIAFSLGVAWLLGRQISKSVRGLAADANLLGQGQPVPARYFPVNELNVVSNALSSASDDRRKADSEIRFLMREVAHRSKNQLTVIASLAKQSAAGATDVEDFGSAFNERIMGLARSTDLLIAGSVGGVELGELIKVQVEPFRPGHDAALTIEGPQFRMSSQAAQTVGLAVHELATNAAKYGALSTPGGELSVTWSVSDGTLKMIWRETLPHEVEEPTRKGFGTRLIVRTFSGALDATVDARYEKFGAVYEFAIPVDKLTESQDGEASDGSA